VKVINPYRTRRTVKAMKKLLKSPGVNVLVLRGPCVARQPTRWDHNVQVKQAKCPGFEGCDRTCMEALACPAIIRNGDEVSIDQEFCQSCGLCVKYCPEKALSGSLIRTRRRHVGV
jgi:indolepyruvate ferredoxin oxidoreductase alpha subunit